ncbi:unnamed protein product [Camellia sinensis]
MELKGQQGSSAYNPIFRESSETLDPPPPPPPPHRLQQNQSTIVQGEKIDQISSRSSLKTDALPESMTTSGVRYRECLKNHAASVGGNVLDGCGEFMVSGDEGTPESLKCAACNCHRNFHRKEVHGSDTDFQRSTMVHPLHLPLPSPAPPPPLQSPSLKHHHNQRINHWTPMVPPVKLSFGGTDSSSEDLDFNGFNSNAAAPPTAPPPARPFVLSKKRFRTKFTEEQKKGMMEFAERVGWRIPKEDDEELQRFCREVGVKRQVLKVWMHNNKNFTKKQPQQQQLQQQESS